MASFDEELLDGAEKLLQRSPGRRGKLPAALVRRSVSTSYYALFHFLSDEVTSRVIGSGRDVRRRRRVLARTISHRGIRAALDKVSGSVADKSVSEFLRGTASLASPAPVPRFVRATASAFADAQIKRHDADYDLNKVLSETDARLLHLRVKRVIAAWRAAASPADRDFKHALCVLILLKGQLRADP